MEQERKFPYNFTNRGQQWTRKFVLVLANFLNVLTRRLTCQNLQDIRECPVSFRPHQTRSYLALAYVCLHKLCTFFMMIKSNRWLVSDSISSLRPRTVLSDALSGTFRRTRLIGYHRVQLPSIPVKISTVKTRAHYNVNTAYYNIVSLDLNVL